MKNKILTTLTMLGAVMATGCSSLNDKGHQENALTGDIERNDMSTGLAVGAAVGAGAAAAFGAGSPIIIYSALVGTGAFGAIGLSNDLDSREMLKELRDRGVVVEDGYKTITISLEEDVTFDLQKTQLKEDFKPTLEGVAMVLKELEGEARIEVVGHADYTGPDELNEYLSQERSEVVAEQLIHEGVNPEMFIDYYGVQSSKPKDYCLSLSCLRRVEIIVHKDNVLYEL